MADRARGFDLARDPLLRFGLFQTSPDTWEVVWSYPHLLLDGWSTGVLLNEFLAAYDGVAEDLPPAVPYTNYLDWIAAIDHGAALERWTSRLADYQELASLPPDQLDRSDRDVAGGPKETTSWSMPPDLVAQLLECGATYGVTINTLVQTLWGVLLGRLTDRTDVVFGATVSGRPETLDGVGRMVGLFINTLPVRVHWREAESFADLARRVQDEAMAGQADGSVPLADIQAATGLRDALFDHLVIFENYPLEERVRGLGEGDQPWRIEAIDVFEETHYPLVLAVAPTVDGFQFRCTYDSARYLPSRMDRLWQQWEHLTRSIVACADQPVRRADPMTAPERTQVLETFARGPVVAEAQTSSQTLSGVVVEALERSGQSPVVSFGDQSLTGAELLARAGRVAEALRDAGVGPETPVGLCLERSLEMVVGMLGIVVAGGAYVPVDPEYPRARIELLFREAGIRTVVTTPGVLEPQTAADVRRVSVESVEVEDVAEPGVPPPMSPDTWPESLAYVLYTSGSTGLPKGVGIPHRALVNHMRWMARAFPLQPDDRVLQKTPFSFDASVWEFWAPLLEGASLVMARPQVHADPRQLVDTIRQERITVLQVVPTMLHALLDEPALRDCVDLRRVFVGGEALTGDLRDRFAATLPSVPLINLYGPTETTIDATCQVCDAGESRRAGEHVRSGLLSMA